MISSKGLATLNFIKGLIERRLKEVQAAKELVIGIR